MTVQLPAGITRFTGDGCAVEVDADGKVFLAFQKQNNLGCLVMIDEKGVAEELPITPQPIGRPRLSCNPFVGLWFVGNQEADAHHVPMTKIAQYTCVEAPDDDSLIAELLGRVAALEQKPTGGGLAGVWQHEPGSIEVGGVGYSYIDLGTGGDYTLRLIVYADGRPAELISTGPLVIRAGSAQLVLG